MRYPVSRASTFLARCLGLVFLTSLLFGAGSAQARLPTQSLFATQAAGQVFLPLLLRPDHFLEDSPIWAHSGAPASLEVALFRTTFYTNSTSSQVELHIFADTRYQAWLDGELIGRGPARFSRDLAEFDIHSTGDLPAGEHVLSVLVQWAPNIRASESSRPFLQAHLQGTTPTGFRIFTRSGSHWQALLSNAWRKDAPLVHAWGLVGPTEILDLRLLSAGWNTLGFNSSSWGKAAWVDPRENYVTGPALPVVDPDTSQLDSAGQEDLAPDLAAQNSKMVFRRRSIAYPVEIPLTPSVLQTGSISPGFTLVEMDGSQSSLVIPFVVTGQTSFIIETLGPALPTADAFLLDGSGVSWTNAGSTRPDVLRSSTTLSVGEHTLIVKIPPQGLTFALSNQGVVLPPLPFQPSANAGRRNLLGEPVFKAIPVQSSSSGITITLDSLPAYLILDLGQTRSARLQANLSGPAGSRVDVGWDERLLSGTTRPLPYPGSLHAEWNQVDSWTLDGTERTIHSIDLRAGRYVLITAWGGGPVTLSELQVIEERYPVTMRGTFRSSEPLLDQIWMVGAASAQVNMTDAYADPWRERAQWWGDAFVIDRVNAITYYDASLLRRGLEYMALEFRDSPAPGAAPNNNGLLMLDYAMLWVQGLSNYTLRTGDTSLMKEYYAELEGFIAYLNSRENLQTHLLDIPQTSWSNSAYIDSRGWSSRSGQSTALNAMYAETLQQAAGLASKAAEWQDMLTWQSRSETVKNSLNQTLYRSSTGVYLTSLLSGFEVAPGPHAQAWPLAYGLAPAGEEQKIATSLLSLLSSDPVHPNLDVYGMYWVLEALGKTGRIEDGLGLIETYYGYMLKKGATTWWERFDANQIYSSSLSHGWGSAPTWFLTTYVLGAQQTAPDEWLAAPALVGVESASGVLPLASGDLYIRWQMDACGSASVVIDAPPETRGVLRLPETALSASLEGDLVWASGESSPVYGLISLSGGSHNLTVSIPCLDAPDE